MDGLLGSAVYDGQAFEPDSPFQRYVEGDHSALTSAQKRGLRLFIGKAACSDCHNGPTLSDGAFHNIGVGMAAKEPDLGRYVVTKLSGDRGAFRTPTLREVARHSPYMHDGSQKTLEEVIVVSVT